MSAFGRMQTGRFGLMPIGSENVTTWWLAAVPSAIVRTKFFERLSKESNALLRVALDPSIILKASQRVQKQRVIFAWLAIKIGLFRQHSTPRCSAAHALSKAWHSPSISTIGRQRSFDATGFGTSRMVVSGRSRSVSRRSTCPASAAWAALADASRRRDSRQLPA